MSDSPRFDGIIFDMDGTLWDAVDSYAAVWNITMEKFPETRRRSAPVTRARLMELMGKPLPEIIRALFPALDAAARQDFIRELEACEREHMPRLGGKLYPGVPESLRALKEAGVKLFMVSNCGPDGLPMFLSFTGLGPFMTEHLSYGSTGCEKDVNIRTLIERYKLKRPLYVGDTLSDLAATRKAGAAFAWAAYGFGGPAFPASQADLVLDSAADIAGLL